MLRYLIALGVSFAIPLRAWAALPETAKLLKPTLCGDWVRSAEPTTYDPTNLFEYIDGEAEHYLAYGFQRAVVGQYTSTADARRVLTVDIYDMGSSAQAFGIYSSHRSPRVKYVEVGAQGYLSGPVLDFWKGRHFFHVQANSVFPDFAEVAKAVGGELASAAPGESTPPAVCALLPADKRVPNSVKWYRQDFMGHSFLRNAAIAAYRYGEETRQVFVVSHDSEKQCREALEKYRTAVTKRAKPLALPETLPAGTVAVTQPYYGTVAVAPVGKHLVGVLKASGIEEAAGLLAPLIRKLISPTK